MNLLPARFESRADLRDATARWKSRDVFLLAATLALAGLAALAVDVPVVHFVHRNYTNDVFRNFAELLGQIEPFAHAAGVAVILLAIAVLDPAHRAQLLRLGACAFGAGLLADVVKVCVIRIRPRNMPDVTSVWDTFHGWLPILRDVSLITERGLQSFPSGHAATAAGFAVCLSWLYPRGKWLFLSLALLGAMQRIATNAHYVSDVFAGAALGCLLGAVLTDPRLLGRWFDRFESRRRRATTEPA
jgi:membrane-associated phospholipid phosphatase